MLTLALDIGGTKIAVGLTDPAGELVHKAIQPTPKDHEAEHVWSLVDTMIADATKTAKGAIRAVGIGSAGPIDANTGTVSPVNIASWRGFPLRDRVATAVPGVPVRLAGDAICMALAEHWRGAGRGAQFLLGMVGWCSTGCGIRDGPAMPVMSDTSSSSPTGSRAPAAAAAASRPWRPDRG